MKQLEMLVADVEQHTAKARGVRRSVRAVGIVRSVVHPARIVEHREQSDDIRVGSAVRSDEQPVLLDAAPVGRSMNGMRAARELARHVLPEPLPVSVQHDRDLLLAPTNVGAALWDHGGTTPTTRAYAMDWPRWSFMCVSS